MALPLIRLQTLAPLLGLALAVGCSSESTPSNGPSAHCGNGVVERGEACDGTDLGAHNCQSAGFAAGPLGCVACQLDTSACVASVCGDGILQPAEACDGAKLGGQTCASLGFLTGELSCQACSLDTSDCVRSICGDGVRQAEEECDGEDFGIASCGALGLVVAGQLGCRSNCRFYTNNCLVCDDGVCHPGETASSCPADCGVVDIAAGYTHTCVVLADGSTWCFGARAGHRMGGTGDVPFPVKVTGLPAATAASAGEAHTCVIGVDQQVYCWGRNHFGELGVAIDAAEVFPPVVVAKDGVPIAGIVSVSAGRHHTCALPGGSVTPYCWGRGDYGAIGAGDVAHRFSTPRLPEYYFFPDPDRGLVPLTGIAAGARHTCTIDSYGDVYCFGSNDRGQLGFDSSYWPPQPALLWYLGPHATALAAGGSHTCFTGGADLYCFGANDNFQLGISGTRDHRQPELVAGRGAVQIAAGRNFTCILATVPGQVQCFGADAFGQLGDGGELDQSAARNVVGLDNAVSISAGDLHACAVLEDGSARCWGMNDFGQLGDPTLAPWHRTPVAPLGLQ